MGYKNEYIGIIKGKAVTSDYTLTENDYAIGVDVSSGEVTITVPTASTISQYPKAWMVKLASDSANDMIVKLQTASDSMYGPEFYAMRIAQQGEGVDIFLNANGKYTFNEAKGLESDYIIYPEVTTVTPSLASTTLTMNGCLDSLGVESTVDVYFRYRDLTDGDAWSVTSDQSVSSIGTFSDTATVTAGHVFQVQAAVETSNGNIYYGEVLETSINYYPDTATAASNNLERYWDMQETAGTDTTATETYGKDMTMYNGVTIGSDTINSNTIYKRIFGASDYGEAALGGDFGAHDHTVFIQVDMNSNSGDHTIFSFGRDILSLASDGSGIQLECGGRIKTWSNATPFSDILNLFIINDVTNDRCILYEANSSSVTQRAIHNNRHASGIVEFFRIGRGASGDSNHQDYEYMDDGSVRSCAIWHKVLSSAEMKDISDILDNDGGLIVA